ncbi:bifunctional pyr operon transcriptional regulator/uracil phosphoribosyltransferase PyrR [soil metagenome]
MFPRLPDPAPPTLIMTDPRARESLMDAAAIERALSRMAREIVEKAAGTENLVLIGIHRRGVHLAERLAGEIRRAEKAEIPTGSLDITLYRDDLIQIGPRPVVGETRLPVAGVDESTVVIVDDVLFTGRTVRAALDELADFGRPRRTLLCVLIDRGGRELPIHADVVGKEMEVRGSDRVEVLVPEIDGRLAVELARGGEG